MLQLVDFHNHFAGAALRADSAYRMLADGDALLASLEPAGFAARVISTPLEFVQGDVRRLNDAMAERVARHPGRLYGLATVDAYDGEDAARELTRAVRELGLRGVFVESAKGELFPDAPQAQPTFAAAAALGVPVFLHPVPDGPLKARFRSCGRSSERLVRSTVNSAALLAMLESGMFERHAGLKVVVTALALNALLLGKPGAGVYIDTTGTNPVMIRAAIDLLGADHVVLGTDWPVVRETGLAERLERMLAGFGLSAEDQRLVAGGNALRLLGEERNEA